MILKTTKINTIIMKHPRLIETLITEYNLHCIGCQMAEFETLEEGATAHGMTKAEIEKMVKKLNQS